MIQRATNTAFSQNLKTFKAKTNAYDDKDSLVYDTFYYYRVSSVNSIGQSDWCPYIQSSISPYNFDDFAVATSI